ncbi:MAG: hypothetical protein R3F55_20410 [Alphaproteobacteria bacterium]
MRILAVAVLPVWLHTGSGQAQIDAHMLQQIESRLAALRAEYADGERQRPEPTAKLEELDHVTLRIAGAPQVLQGVIDGAEAEAPMAV